MTIGYSCGYDQLNRLVNMRQHSISSTWSNSNIINTYSESIAYDTNGNIFKIPAERCDKSGMPLDMDSLNYIYERDEDGQLLNNKLNSVRDEVSASNYSEDIDNQSENNYEYDLIGNLTKDSAEGLDPIKWTL
jgi:hypothetical protein